MKLQAKICGLQDEAALHAALDGGAAMVGFVFYPPSKNYIAPTAARALASMVPAGVQKVGLFVDARDDEVKQILSETSLDLLQLHGKETPQRVAELKKLTGLPAMKALRLKSREHFDVVASYEGVADRFLFDSRIGHEKSGGPLDWAMLAQELGQRPVRKPWMLAGGLNAGNLAEAVRLSGAQAVDVSSGVEDAHFQKSPDKIREFLALAKQL